MVAGLTRKGRVIDTIWRGSLRIIDKKLNKFKQLQTNKKRISVRFLCVQIAFFSKKMPERLHICKNCSNFAAKNNNQAIRLKAIVLF